MDDDTRGGGCEGVSGNGKTHPVICVFRFVACQNRKILSGTSIMKANARIRAQGRGLKIAKEIEAIYFRS